MNYEIKTISPFKVIGFIEEFDGDTSYREIPKFWDKIYYKYMRDMSKGCTPKNEYEKAIIDNSIGEYGICIDDMKGKKFHYMIAGKYNGGEVPEGMVIYEIKKRNWAVFNSYGPLPNSLQSVNTLIFKEWLPNNKEYKLDGNITLEWYDPMADPNDPAYHSTIWIPIKKNKD